MKEKFIEFMNTHNATIAIIHGVILLLNIFIFFLTQWTCE